MTTRSSRTGPGRPVADAGADASATFWRRCPLIEGETAINRATLEPMPSLLTAHDKPPTWVESDAARRGPDEAPEPIRVASVLVLLRRRYLVIVTAVLAGRRGHAGAHPERREAL